MKCPLCSTPRARNAAATREAILAAARRRFLDESYENVGVRDIAGDVGVDATLVNRYFGSKEELFKEVLREGKAPTFTGPPEGLPAHLADLVADDDQHSIECLLIILRSASSPAAAEIVARTVHEDMLEPLAERLDGRDAELRATLAMSVMVGATVLRSILGVTTIAEGDQQKVHGRLVEMLSTALADRKAAPSA